MRAWRWRWSATPISTAKRSALTARSVWLPVNLSRKEYSMAEAYIIDAVRTPRGVGKPGKGALSHLHPQHLAATVLAAIRDRNNLDTATVDDIVWSTSSQNGKQGGDLGRMAALSAGYDTKASGTTLDRFCGGGISSVNFAAASVMSGMEDCVIAGGTEMMSYTTAFAAEQANAGLPPRLMGSGHEALDELHPQSHQGVCGDAIATIEGISREALDHEKSPRPETTAEGLASLKPAFTGLADFDLGGGFTFRKQVNRRYPDVEIQNFHHAGNSSGVVDGAAAILLASKDYADKHGLKPRARVVAYANMGDDPTLMLNAPVPAAKKVLEKAGLTKDDIDVWEINEAFSVVAEKFIRDLDLDREKVNINCGAMALGHPIGATGSILIGTALDELERSGGRYGLVTMCAAGGMAPAIIIERI